MVNEQVNIDMVEAAGIQPGDLVLEIGPGTGSLTHALVEAGANIIAVEKVPTVLYHVIISWSISGWRFYIQNMSASWLWKC